MTHPQAVRFRQIIKQSQFNIVFEELKDRYIYSDEFCQLAADFNDFLQQHSKKPIAKNKFDKIQKSIADRLLAFLTKKELESCLPSESECYCYVFTITSAFLEGKDIFPENICEDFKRNSRYDENEAEKWRPFYEAGKNRTIKSLMEDVQEIYPRLGVYFVSEFVESTGPYVGNIVEDQIDSPTKKIYCVVDALVAFPDNNPWYPIAKKFDRARLEGVVTPKCMTFSSQAFENFELNRNNLFSNIRNRWSDKDFGYAGLCLFDTSESDSFVLNLRQHIKASLNLGNYIQGEDHKRTPKTTF